MVEPFGIFSAKAVPLNLFVKTGVRIRFKHRKPIVFGVRDAGACMQLLEVAIRADGRDYRQLSFPGMHVKKVDPSNIE